MGLHAAEIAKLRPEFATFGLFPDRPLLGSTNGSADSSETPGLGRGALLPCRSFGGGRAYLLLGNLLPPVGST